VVVDTIMQKKKVGGDPPVYSDNARNRRATGAVVMAALIGRDGKVRDLSVVSAGDESLVKSALDAARTWKYSPYLVNGKPVEVFTTITIHFAAGT